MYINFPLLVKSDLDMIALGTLLAIKQKDFDFYCEILNNNQQDNSWQKLLNLGYIEPLKSKSGYKVSKSGENLIKGLEIANLEEIHKEQYKTFVDSYLSLGLSKDKLGNTKRGLTYYIAFLAESGFSYEDILATIEDYLDSNSREPIYIRKLSDLFCKQDNVYSTKFDLSKSKLYSLCKDRGVVCQ